MVSILTKNVSRLDSQQKDVFVCAFTLNSSDGISFLFSWLHTIVCISVALACRGGVAGEQIK